MPSISTPTGATLSRRARALALSVLIVSVASVSCTSTSPNGSLPGSAVFSPPPAPPPSPYMRSLTDLAPAGKTNEEFNRDVADCSELAKIPSNQFNKDYIACMLSHGNTERVTWSDASVYDYPPTVIWHPAPHHVSPSPPAAPGPPSAKAGAYHLTDADYRAIGRLALEFAAAYPQCKDEKYFKSCIATKVGPAILESVGPVFCAHQEDFRPFFAAANMSLISNVLGCTR